MIVILSFLRCSWMSTYVRIVPGTYAVPTATAAVTANTVCSVDIDLG